MAEVIPCATILIMLQFGPGGDLEMRSSRLVSMLPTTVVLANLIAHAAPASPPSRVPQQEAGEPQGGRNPAATSNPPSTPVITMTGACEAPKIADQVHRRAAAGEDFEKLQMEAFEAAGVKSATPLTANPQIRRGSQPASQASVFDMKAGENSPVLNDPSGYYFFYRLMSKTKPSLADTREAIRDAIRNQRQTMHDNGRSAVSYQLNREYFGPDAPPNQGKQGIPRSMPANHSRPGPPAGQPQQ